MKELRLTDRELQLIAPALRDRLSKAGFVAQDSEGNQPAGFAFPITLNLVGDVELRRDEDEGVWIFRQVEHGDVAERTEFAERAHVEAASRTAADIIAKG